MQIAVWMRERETPGTAAYAAKQLVDSDKPFKAAKRNMDILCIWEALLKHEGNQQRTARAIGVNRQTVRRVLRGIRVTGEQVRVVAKRLQEMKNAEV